MKEKINIADILKDKPVGLKFYSNTFGYISFNGVHKDKVYFFSEDTNAHSVKPNGKMYDGGECIIFPSKEMRDWDKFSWKKGDVLVNKDRDVYIIFEKFEDDTYTRFKGKHYLWKECNVEDYNKEETKMLTSVFEKAADDVAQTYIKTIEERLGGKLNLETLEIEKQTEFKDGDIAFADYGNKQDVFVVSGRTSLSEGYISFISLDLSSLTLSMGFITSFFKEDLCKLRLATEEEEKQLFSALAKEGKAWDAEKKQIVDLKPKVELKPFDKVLCRNSKDDTWEADFFARLTRKEIDYTQSGKYLCVGDLWMYCIPYNEETAHLLGTTDEWKGGEQ
jgi:hypothetical protein